jgi:U32 family peptidase
LLDGISYDISFCIMKKPEILSPAGNLEMLETACLYGADAVYMGLSGGMNLRAKAGNFSPDILDETVSYAHSRNVRVYLTLNIYPHDSDIRLVKDSITTAKEAGVDAIIVSDIGVASIVKDIWPQAILHLSTQANTVNVPAIHAWMGLGIKRVILARELSAEEIGYIRKNVSAELEVFIHGSVCISISGRCLISSYLNSRDANRGECTQPCRWDYALVEKTRPSQYMPVIEEDGFTFLYNSKDICLLPVFADVMRLGLDGLKIEGRNRTPLYVATVTSVYRQARDEFLADPEGFSIKTAWIEEIRKTSNREYFPGFFTGIPGTDSMKYDFTGYEHSHHLAARIISANVKRARLEARNPLIEGMELEWLSSAGDRVTFTLEGAAADGGPVSKIRPNSIFEMDLPFKPLAGELIRKPYSEGDRVVERRKKK